MCSQWWPVLRLRKSRFPMILSDFPKSGGNVVPGGGGGGHPACRSRSRPVPFWEPKRILPSQCDGGQ